MKRIFALFLTVIMLTSFMCPISYADAEQADIYNNYDIIKEVAYAFDRQGAQLPYDQLNSRRSVYASPEDATSQRTIFLDCSSFVNACYREAFGVNIMPFEISADATETSPNTKNYDAYAKNNQTADDVVGYWEPQTYTTDEERQEIVDWIANNIEIGDTVTYRHGKTPTSVKGHVYMYMGNNTFMHCRGAGSYTVNKTNPMLSYDNDAAEMASKGTIETCTFADIFENTTHTRYLFKKTASDTVWSFSILRPLARGLTPTEETVNRMKIAGLSLEKTSSVWENSSVKPGDILTYTITLENTKKATVSGVTISDIIPENTEFVSAASGVSVSGNSLFWQGDVPAAGTLKINYSVRVTSDAPGTLIKSNETYVSGVKLGNITHTVSNFSVTQQAMIADAAIRSAMMAKAYTDGIELAKDVYKSAFNIDLFDYETITSALDDLIDEENLVCHTSTDISKMIVPNLYGGLDINSGRLYIPSENDRTSLPMEQHLSVGDIILADWAGGSTIYIYAGDKRLVTVDGGSAKLATIGDNIYGANQDNIIISLLGYNRFAVLRPTMIASAPKTDVTSIKIVTPPSKLTYQNGDSFDPTGMAVRAFMNDGTSKEIVGYTVSPSSLAELPTFVTIDFGGFTAQVDITVNLRTDTVNRIFVDGVPITGFHPDVTSYKIETEKIGTVTAESGNDVELLITQSNSFGEPAYVTAHNKKTDDFLTYNINFTKLAIPGINMGMDFVSIDAPKIPEEQNPPAHINDGDLSTRFAVDGYDGSATFTVDLGSSKLLSGFSLAFYNGHTRKNKFTLEVSEDNANWTKVFDGFSTGTTDAIASYEVIPTRGQYVRFTGYGCYADDEKTQKNVWNSINEFVVHEETSDFADTQGHWAQPEIFFSLNHGLVEGIGNNLYMPENSVTRAEFLAMIVRACKFSEVAYEDGTFSDVKTEDWFSKFAMSAKDNGIIPAEMIEDGNLYPNQNLTREEMCAIATLAYTAATYKEIVSPNATSMFIDISDGPYLSYIDKAIALRVVNGMGDDTFAPKANITRAQAATILRRVYIRIFNVRK